MAVDQQCETLSNRSLGKWLSLIFGVTLDTGKDFPYRKEYPYHRAQDDHQQAIQ